MIGRLILVGLVIACTAGRLLYQARFAKTRR
jgi:hypothetical protein